jgi:hypothetical protein
MDTQEILSKIAKLKKAVESESDSDVKASYNKKIAALEAQVADAEAKVEKKEEKAAAEEKKTLSDADEKIKKLEKALASESDPDVKARYQKKLNELKGTIQVVKEEIKEEKKEIAEQKKEIKQAVKEVKSVQKEVRKTAIKKVAAKKVERKKIDTKKTKRKEKLNRVLSDLDALIEKNKKLKSKYGSGYKGTGKPTDLERDANRKAKPFGYRFVGKYDYRVPTEIQIKRGLKRGTIDYEARPNRADVNPSKKIKLALGGTVLSDAFASESLREELESKMKKGDPIVSFAYTDYGGSFGDKVAIEYFKENHPKNIVFENTGYGGQNGIVFGEPAKEFLKESKNYLLGYEDMESFYYEMVSEQEVKDFKMFLSDIKNKYIVKKDALNWLTENKGGYYSMEPNGLDFSYEDLEKELEQEGLIKRKMADGGMMDSGGMMAKGGTITSDQLKKIQRKFDLNEDKNYHSENVVLLADAFGSEQDKMEAKRILALHKKEGSLSSENGKKRRDLSIKLFKAWDKEREKSGLMADGGMMGQGYDDREDERLGMRHGKMYDKDLKSTHARRDDARFEERADGGMMDDGGMMRRGGRTKAAIAADKRYKALKAGKRVSENGNVYYESRENHSDVNRRNKLEDGGMMKKGGKVGSSKEDKARFAKPAGWRWKEEALTKRIIERKQLSMSPSKKMRDKYPDLVYYEDRLNKADKKPTRTSADSI